MKKLSRCYLRLFIFTFIFFSSCASENLIKKPVLAVWPLNYEVDLNDRADDLFKVRLFVNDLTSENAIYQFAATAPGTYQVMDIGRFLGKFEGFYQSGEII